MGFVGEILGALPLCQRMPLIKVHKRGAIGRSIDIGRFSEYGELYQALAHMFGIEGQLEERQTKGWTCLYQDDEGDFLLLGDGPWEEFVISIKSIQIMSPQEVDQKFLQKLGGGLASRL
ncbi:auxin response factor 5 isoform X2 [Triticum aestivum]|uniref:auxin response factor 5 isoform X2 n=1 Tax=Triticum aestivum TaxID=4565 RepID=UPI001D00CAF6|nr:auxin response factor 5-like isoform X2 [Triticum aestivum]